MFKIGDKIKVKNKHKGKEGIANIDLAYEIKKARLKRKMTQDDVAEIMHTKKPAISRLEMGDDVKNIFIDNH